MTFTLLFVEHLLPLASILLRLSVLTTTIIRLDITSYSHTLSNPWTILRTLFDLYCLVVRSMSFQLSYKPIIALRLLNFIQITLK